MEKCWISKRGSRKSVVLNVVAGVICAGMAVAALIVFLWFVKEYALPIPTYLGFFFGICFGFELIIRGARSLSLLILFVISIACLAGVDSLSPFLLCCPYGYGLGFTSLLFILCGIIEPVEATREYELSDQGITIQYLGKYRRFYPWERIRNICVCTLFRKSDLEPGTLAIWCTAGKLRFEPPKGNANRTAWNQEEYLSIHFCTVLTMDYSPERVEEFQKYSQREIPDYREL